ncbi:MAG: MBL fold metallo-hydrolase [Nitrospinota bacterium]|nr:MBL fold metallo-hydrolase [Nitrospinota bacterium]
MKITILGSGTSVPSLDRNSSGVLVQHAGQNNLFDFGYGNLHQLLSLGITYHDIDRIFFTHNHPDHMCDLIIFLFGSRYHEQPRTKDLPIIAGPGFKKFFDGVNEAFKRWLIPATYRIEIIEQDEETCYYGGLQVTSKKVNHIEISRGYRIIDASGTIAAISGDTDYCDSMAQLGKDADLMILECSFPDDMKCAGHLTPRLAGKLGREADCKKLCLTHFYPPCDMDEVRKVCREEYEGQLFLAEDLMVFEF